LFDSILFLSESIHVIRNGVEYYTESLDNEKINLGQAGQAFLPSQTLYDNRENKLSIKCANVVNGEQSENSTFSEVLLTTKDQVCPETYIFEN